MISWVVFDLANPTSLKLRGARSRKAAKEDYKEGDQSFLPDITLRLCGFARDDFSLVCN